MWRQFAATVAEAQADAVSDLFQGLGAVSVSLEDAGDQPLFEPKPGETPLWQRTKVVGLFEADADEALARAAIEQALGAGLLGWEGSVLEDQAWERAWLNTSGPWPSVGACGCAPRASSRPSLKR